MTGLESSRIITDPYLYIATVLLQRAYFALCLPLYKQTGAAVFHSKVFPMFSAGPLEWIIYLIL